MSGKRTALYRLALVALVAALSVFCACKVDEPYRRPSSYAPDQSLFSQDQEQAIVRHPLTLISKRLTTAGCAVRYPYVCDDGMDALNVAVHMAFTEFAEACGTDGGRVAYSVEFNRYGLLSLIMTCSAGSGKVLFTDTANFDTDAGKRVYLSSCFGQAAEGVKERLTELLSAEAETRGTKPIGALPEFDDSTPFVFTYGGICLIFREYEVFPPEAGLEKLKVPAAAVDYSQDGLIARLK